MALVKAFIAERDGQNLAEMQEIDFNNDTLQAKGLAFEGSASYVMEKIGGILKATIPSYSLAPTYDAGDDLIAYEIFNGNTQTTINRRVRGDFTYTSGNLTGESWKIYDESDGTTVLRTITVTHSYTSDQLTNTEVSES